MSSVRKVRVVINPKSGLGWSPGNVQDALEKYWDIPEIDLTYQYSLSAEDGQKKARRAVDYGVDTILVVGGDGMINSIGAVLVGTDVALGVIPTGSGNGFARHFGVPLSVDKAAKALLQATKRRIDVGTANGQPFFVTCSMAWDAALLKTFEKSPVRGVLPYVFAGMYEFFEYRKSSFELQLDNDERLHLEDPLLFTVANLTQYGGGAVIAPDAEDNDGQLELVTAARKDAPKLLPNMIRLFNRSIHKVPEVLTRSFHTMDVYRQHSGPIQLDGELVEAGRDVSIRLMPEALSVLVPQKEQRSED